MKTYEGQPLDLMQYINTKYHEAFIREKLEFSAPLPCDRLSAAVTRLAEKFPLLKCVYDAENNVFIEKDALETETCLCVSDKTEEELLTETFDVREKLIQYTLSGNCLYVTVSHLVCDGSGFRQLLYLLCETYNGSAGNKDFDYLMNRSFHQLTEGLSAADTRKMTMKMLFSLMKQYKSRPIYEKAAEEKEHIVTRTVAAPQMEKLHAFAKSRGATLNDVFLTLYARSLHKQFGWNKITVPCTVDLRKYAKSPAGIGNLTGTYSCNVRIAAKEDFSVTLDTVSACMQGQKRTKNDLAGPALLVSKYEKSTKERFLKLYGNMDTSAFTDYTNLGVNDEKKLSFDGAALQNAVMFSCNSKAPCFQLAVSSFRGATTFSALFSCDERGKETADALFDNIIEEINAVSSV